MWIRYAAHITHLMKGIAISTAISQERENKMKLLKVVANNFKLCEFYFMNLIHKKDTECKRQNWLLDIAISAMRPLE